MREPAFWNTAPDALNWRARLLSPLGKVYAAATARRLRNVAGHRPDVPVVCVGNINAGGTGKTPTTIALMMHLAERGLTPHVVSRGYGGSLAGPVQVSEKKHKADETGDEPLLLAAFGATWVAKDRAAGARAAQSAGADVILMDDGFQNPSLTKDISIVVVDARRGFGNGLCIPAGPLREPVAAGMARADLVMSIGDAAAQNGLIERWGDEIGDVPRLKGEVIPLQTGMDWTGTPFLAFAGIGHPEKFFATLRGLGATLVGTHALDDHQPLTTALLTRLDADARRLGAQLVTTEKDAVRLPAAFRPNVLTVPVRLLVEDWSALDQALDRVLSARG